ncbi:MAG: HAMP domain-containing histidine kinase [Sphingomonadaceae bacterium]|nr:HAMP domain-containing histidine kinase [Sphingomonadaceae bacterium]MCP5390787.1 HAMP domain-containing histidine kinase [Sphingomonadaceae bacterium]MCP5394183.1 HAMP domain-containing histidine kinase [Sphingomonadaceae bacterium]
MARLTGTFLARAKVDADGHLAEAQDPLAALQLRCGGELPGTIAIPELREAVFQCLANQRQVSRGFSAFDGEERIEGWVEVVPDEKAGGCLLGISSWQATPYEVESDPQYEQRRLDVDRSVAEIAARLDPAQGILAVDGRAADVVDTVAAMGAAVGRPWTDFVTFPGDTHRQPMHWRLLDGAHCSIAGSERSWSVHLVPLGAARTGAEGFELYLIPDRILAPVASEPVVRAKGVTHSIGRELAPVLRQPIARIIANAETIRTKMAGPLAEEYSSYAADIASAGQHLLSLIEDLSDLEVVESEDFSTAPDQIDLGDVARRAAGILSVRAQEKSITLVSPDMTASVPAVAEFRRVLQILLNLVGNAIRYSPDSSTVTIGIEERDNTARIWVADEGPGLDQAQQDVIFEKFERLGRSGDGGSGLGLYISRRIARAMGGELDVESAPGQGARFILDLPPDR